MKKIDVIQKEISDIQNEQKLLIARLENTTDESAKLFLQNLVNYNEESINNLIEKQLELSK